MSDPLPSARLPKLPHHLSQVLWQGNQLGAPLRPTCTTGHALLDAELPGGGWPRGSLTELLVPGCGRGELRLLAPTLARLSAQAREVVWIQPPERPYLPALEALGLSWRHLLWVRTEHSDDAAWAADQALRSPGCGAVLWWSPEHRPGGARLGTPLRRLQLAAQHGDACLWVIRPSQMREQSSPAPLRLTLDSLAGQPGVIEVDVFKRRGPPCAQPLHLDTRNGLPPVLAHRLAQGLSTHPAERGRPIRPVTPPTRMAPRTADPALKPWLQSMLAEIAPSEIAPADRNA